MLRDDSRQILSLWEGHPIMEISIIKKISKLELNQININNNELLSSLTWVWNINFQLIKTMSNNYLQEHKRVINVVIN